MNVVRARFRHHVQKAPTGAAELCREAIGENLELLHGFLGHDEVRHFRLTCGGAEEDVVEVRAVHGDVGVDAFHATHGDREASAARSGRQDVGRGQRKVLEITTLDGKVLDGAFVEPRGNDRTRGLDERRLSRHGNDFLHRRDLDGQITKALKGADRHHQTLALQRLEPAELRGERVRTYR